MRTERQAARRRKKQESDNRAAIVTVSAVVLCMAVAVGLKAGSLAEKQKTYIAREQVLMEQLEAEQERARQLEQERLYIQTDGYIEKTAKEKLGLVNPDEILLKPQQ